MNWGAHPQSSASRQLISAGAKYGLTIGNYNSEYLELTPDGASACNSDPSLGRDRLNTLFYMAISKTEAFNSIYEQLKNKRIPTASVLSDLMSNEGIDEGDHDNAADIFIKNAGYLRIIRNQSGSDYIIPFEQVLEDLPSPANVTPEDIHNVVDEDHVDDQTEPIPVTRSPTTKELPKGPSLHIDIQIHIDSTANAEQIDQIFASMSHHLYGREG